MMKSVIRCIVVLIVGMILLAGRGYAAENNDNRNDWGLFIEGKNANPDVLPIETPNGIVLPIRFVIEGLGGTIDWDPHTKEVRAEINGQKLYIHFHRAAVASTMTLNGEQVGSLREHVPVIVSGRTMVHQTVVEKIINMTITSFTDVQLASVQKKRDDLGWEQLVLYVHEADERLFQTFKSYKNATRVQLEQQLTTCYTYEIAQVIIEHYYRKRTDGLYQVLPTEKPLAIAPITNIEELKAMELPANEKGFGWILQAKRKPTAFSSHAVHSQYEIRLQDKQWSIVEISHHLVDNGVMVNDM